MNYSRARSRARATSPQFISTILNTLETDDGRVTSPHFRNSGSDRSLTLLAIGLCALLLGVVNIIVSTRIHSVVIRPHHPYPFDPNNHTAKLRNDDAAIDNTAAAAAQTDHASLLPPIYWINLQTSVDRRESMLKSFESLGIPSNHHHRVIASNIPQLLNASKSGHLIFHPEIRLEAHGIRPKPHQQNIYYYSEAACLLSHLNAIKRAYEDGHDLVLFLEDDAVLSTTFLEHWRDYVNHEATPDGWKILQFATVNPHVIRQGVLLREHFVSWQPYHWSTRAYVMNREGMQTLMEGAYVSSSTDNSRDNALGGWQIPSSLPPMVVADEVIYSIVGDAYTSTGLWVDSFEGHGSTVQSKESNADVNEGIMHSYSVPGDLVDHVTMKKEHDKFWFEESLLVMMNVRVSDEGGMERDIRWIRQDFHAACRFH
eukprot:CAMPEP_0201602878 /NCGR_PEP_ID=MMETSP0492-20130828/3483_1 /ASSEMBLY_ACC=CAM_ASM_000837 /TAXON_ID=420259 /ORGANISM="Thalassiosira gravida, Strain GMp14c1" /LENGTH=427 /DNA_ID=CAMNT_0048066515 /DNA_START=327 /DNA_END=1607 /DNA_ORIENTATION=+